MRGIGAHIPPAHTQVTPYGNTSVYVTEQVDHWVQHGTLIHPEIAREIAAGWASGDTELTAFATTGRVDTNPLVNEINHDLQAPEVEITDDQRRELMALIAYVRGATMAVELQFQYADSQGFVIDGGINAYAEDECASVSVWQGEDCIGEVERIPVPDAEAFAPDALWHVDGDNYASLDAAVDELMNGETWVAPDRPRGY